MESTFNWYWLVDGLQEQGFNLQLVNTAAVTQYDGHGLAPKIVWGTEVPGAGMPGRVPALIQMGDWCGVYLPPMPKTLT